MSAADIADKAPDNPVASVLERAAKGIRERAEAATPGPWEATGTDIVSRSANRHWAGACAANAADDDAWHIVSWHPLVALSVAALLEETAERATLSMTWEAAECTHGCQCWDAALAVARTWLGEAVDGAVGMTGATRMEGTA